MDLGLTGKVAIVCASSQGIGRAVAESLAREGARLTLCARNEGRLTRAVQELRSAHDTHVVSVRADVSRTEDRDRVVQATLETYGRIDILVNNTGGPPAGRAMMLKDEQWLASYHSLFLGALHFCRLVIPHMQQQRWGRIVNINSVASVQPIPDLVISNALRAGLLGLMKTLAREFASDNILITNVCPGYTSTERVLEHAAEVAQVQDKDRQTVLAEWGSKIPLGRMAEPQEIGDVVAFLASERTSYLTGATITVDGGYVQGLL